MNSLKLPQGYHSNLNVIATQKAIKDIKDFFQTNLASKLHLTRVTAPMFVTRESGLNDDLNGVEKAVSFAIREENKQTTLEIVHSLAKWKRFALKEYGFAAGTGIYTDMNAIRADETLDNIHSIYVDQWDWEKVITSDQRTYDYLKQVVNTIYQVFVDLDHHLLTTYPNYKSLLPNEIHYIETQDLENKYPNLTPKEREREITKTHKAVFLTKIGGTLASGIRHDGRSPDYDDWDLNGDLLLWNPVLDDVLELSSMGIRVSPESLIRQLKISGSEDRLHLEYHSLLVSGKLPLTIGGGIGQSRMCMFFLQKAHIGEVQSSYWPESMRRICANNGINLL